VVRAQQTSDKRLLGTWKSDARRTLERWVYPAGLSDTRRRRFARLFGRLTVRYTPSRIVSEFRGYRTVDRYKVMGKDQGGVAILSWKNDSSRGEISHIHFDGNHYWVMTGAVPNVEFFRRLRKRRSNMRLVRTGGAASGRQRGRVGAGRSTAGR